MTPEVKLMTVEEAVIATKLSRATLYRALASGSLEARKCGRSTRILEADLARFLERLPAYTPGKGAGAAAKRGAR